MKTANINPLLSDCCTYLLKTFFDMSFLFIYIFSEVVYNPKHLKGFLQPSFNWFKSDWIFDARRLVLECLRKCESMAQHVRAWVVACLSSAGRVLPATRRQHADPWLISAAQRPPMGPSAVARTLLSNTRYCYLLSSSIEGSKGRDTKEILPPAPTSV